MQITANDIFTLYGRVSFAIGCGLWAYSLLFLR